MRARTTFIIMALLMFGTVYAQENVRWDTLTPEQQQVLDRFANDWDSMPAERQQRLATGADRWLGMSTDERQSAQQRFERWRNLDTDRRDLIREQLMIQNMLARFDQRRELQAVR